MLIGDTPALVSIGVRMRRPPQHVGNFFEAIGEISGAPAATPIDTVVMPESLVRQHGRGSIDALRRVDPSLRIIALTDQHGHDGSHDLAGFDVDVCLSASASEEDLQQVFADELLEEPTAQTLPSPSRVVEVAAPETASPIAPQVVPSSPVSYALGDVDLVEAALLRPDILRDLSLQLIREHTRCSDLYVRDARAEGEAAPLAQAEISFHGHGFGWLCSRSTSAEALQPWAAWLARWLALDRDRQSLQMLAYQDDLTAAWNRRYFEKFLSEAITIAGRVRRPVTLMVFDIDNFKTYNDRFGHEAGDEVLRETVRLMQASIRPTDRVCRIGGDEFVVIFADLDPPREKGSAHPESIEFIAKRFQDQICQMKFPKLGIDALGTLSISAGLATYPWDGNDVASLLRHADQLALESKRKGKNAITFGPGAATACRPQSPAQS